MLCLAIHDCTFYISTSRSICAMPSMVFFCCSLISRFPNMFLRCFVNDCEIVPSADIITGIAFVFRPHMRCISVARSLYFKICSAVFLRQFYLRKLQQTSTYVFLFFNITDNDVRCIVRGGSGVFLLLIPKYVYFIFITCLYIVYIIVIIIIIIIIIILGREAQSV